MPSASKLTAKVFLQTKTVVDPEQGDVQLGFAPDYADEDNKAWAATTPALSFTMTVKPDVATKLEVGWAYTVTFTETK